MRGDLAASSTAMFPYPAVPWLALRKLFKVMLQLAPVDNIKKDGELCAGGDVRIKKNKWLRDVLESHDRRGRLCRESKIRQIVSLMHFKLQLCGGPRTVRSVMREDT